MSNIKSPGVTVAYRQAADRAISRGRHGVAAVILRDAAANLSAKSYVLSGGQVPGDLGKDTQEAIQRAWLGYIDRPRQLLVYVMGASATITSGCDALKWLSTQSFDYIAGHDKMTSDESAALKDFVLEQRRDNRRTCVAVLPNTKGDSEAVVNFVGADLEAKDGKTYTTAAYCGRIAGLLAGTPDSMSATYAPLPDLLDCKRSTVAEQGEATGRGELTVLWDGEKVKVGRAVNSLTTVEPPKAESWQKIRLVRIVDGVLSDIVRTAEDAYIGKVSNTYEHKLSLVVAIRSYLAALIQAGQLSHGECDIDTAAQRKYLEDHKVPGALDMEDAQVRAANTGSHVFLTLSIMPVDAMEDITLTVEIGGAA